MKRIFDCTVVLVALFLFGLPMLLVALLIKLTSLGPVLYWSDRVGRYNRIFRMPKFRTMRIDPLARMLLRRFASLLIMIRQSAETEVTKADPPLVNN